ncbi:hypothetical protein PIB30_078390 [Stylosanthes scabra]|uniref:Uncharacterized protein n=1 Tax=Stylosanthes scabra TaxID=79078 RepID=A0ABU6YP30_9FABA|nr:hypothetical protein [Stylosanthes scabra]
MFFSFFFSENQSKGPRVPTHSSPPNSDGNPSLFFSLNLLYQRTLAVAVRLRGGCRHRRLMEFHHNGYCPCLRPRNGYRPSLHPRNDKLAKDGAWSSEHYGIIRLSQCHMNSLESGFILLT